MIFIINAAKIKKVLIVTKKLFIFIKQKTLCVETLCFALNFTKKSKRLQCFKVLIECFLHSSKARCYVVFERKLRKIGSTDLSGLSDDLLTV